MSIESEARKSCNSTCRVYPINSKKDRKRIKSLYMVIIGDMIKPGLPWREAKRAGRHYMKGGR